jgi:hypothetical protein
MIHLLPEFAHYATNAVTEAAERQPELHLGMCSLGLSQLEPSRTNLNLHGVAFQV